MIWLLPHGLPPFPVTKLARPATHRKTEKERQLADRRGGERAGEEQIIRRRGSLVLSINHSILLVFTCQIQLQSF